MEFKTDLGPRMTPSIMGPNMRRGRAVRTVCLSISLCSPLPSYFMFGCNKQQATPSSLLSTAAPELVRILGWRWLSLNTKRPPSTVPTVLVTWGTSSVRDSTVRRSTLVPVLSVATWISGTTHLHFRPLGEVGGWKYWIYPFFRKPFIKFPSAKALKSPI